MRGVLKQLPMKADIRYHTASAFRPVLESQLAVLPALPLHPAMFSFGNNSSLKDNPEFRTCHKIAREIMQDGFLISGECLLIKMPMDTGAELLDEMPEWDGLMEGPSVRPGSLCYIKGSARMVTLLTVLSIIMEDGMDIR